MKKKTKRDYFVSCIVAAGGKGTRMGTDINKIFLDLSGVPVLSHTLHILDTCEYIDEIILVTAECDILGCHDIVHEFGIKKVKTITKGGTVRSESVKNGLNEVSENSDIVMVHDAARPLVTHHHLKEVIKSAKEFGASALGVPEKNTLKQVDENGFISHTIDRSSVYAIHTPQVFSHGLIKRMYEAENEILSSATDDCMLAEMLGIKIKMVEDSYENIKITTQDDLILAEQIIEKRENG